MKLYGKLNVAQNMKFQYLFGKVLKLRSRLACQLKLRICTNHELDIYRPRGPEAHRAAIRLVRALVELPLATEELAVDNKMSKREQKARSRT